MQNIRITNYIKSKMKYTENDYQNKCNELSLKYIGYHSEKHKGNMIEYICPKHEDKGLQFTDWGHFHVSSIGCPYCTGRYKTTEEVQKQIDDIGLNVKLVSEYLGNEKPIKCRCSKCDNTWVTLPKVLLTNKSACPKCGKEKAIKSETKTHLKFVNELKVVNSFITVIGEYTGTHRWVECKCNICNRTFNGMPSRLLRNESSCPYCNMSGGEIKMLIALDKLNIKYKRQYIIKECRNKLPLRFDAFDVTNNVGFEYNGEQHYYPIKMKSKTYDSEKAFVLTQQRDKIKTDYCQQNNIPLIIVPYWERDNIQEFLQNEFKRRNIYN